MLNYSSPEVKFLDLLDEDVISTSDGNGGGNSDTETPDDDLWG